MRTWEEIWAISSAIIGSFSQSEANRLYSLSANLKKGSNIVEIGSYLGRSSVILGMVSKDYGHNLVCIDPFITADLDGNNAKPTFLENMKKTDAKYKLYEEKSNDVAKIYKKKIDLLFIDGNHLYHDDNWGGVKDDCELWLPKVKAGSYVLFHDYRSSWEGVKRAVDEAKNISVVDIADTMIITQKIGDD